MNIIFFGSSNFAILSLKALLTSGHKVSCVVTQPDRQKGRRLQLSGTEIKRIALEYGLRVYQPHNVNLDETVCFLNSFEADLFVVTAYGQILSSKNLDVPKIFSINIHASLLPKYRGAAPINWAIIKGEKTTGITIIKMTQDMDAGPIILQEDMEITDDDTTVTLEDKLSVLAAQLLLNSLQSIEKNNYNLTPQDERGVSFAPKLKKDDGRINWNMSAHEIYNLIRGCIHWPGAFTYYKGKLLKVYEAKVIRLSNSQSSRLPGEIIRVSKEGIAVATGKGDLLIEELQMQGKRRMKVAEFIAGHKIYLKETLDKK